MRSLYGLSIACGAAPLMIGIAILLAWLWTRISWLELAGMLTIAVGLVLIFCGLILLVLHILRSRKQNKSISKRELVVPLLILLLNFPAGLFSLAIAINVMTTSTVTVINRGEADVVSIVVSNFEEALILPPVKSGGTHTEKLRFEHEGRVTYTLTVAGQEKSGVLIGYVTPSKGVNVQLAVTESGAINIEETY